MEGSNKQLSWLARALATAVLVFIGSGFSLAGAVTISAPIGATNGSGAAFAFVGGSDGNVWLNTNYGGTYHWQNLAPLSVAFGAGTLSRARHETETYAR